MTIIIKSTFSTFRLETIQIALNVFPEIEKFNLNKFETNSELF